MLKFVTAEKKSACFTSINVTRDDKLLNQMLNISWGHQSRFKRLWKESLWHIW